MSQRQIRTSIVVLALTALALPWTLVGVPFVLPAKAVDVENLIKEGIKNQLPRMNQAPAPIKVEQKAQKIEDIVQRQDIPYSFPTMIPLAGISISGLGPKAVSSLSENYFVVKSNTNVLRMADIYKENRLSGKSNYVTIDSILHPYLALTNRIQADLIKRHLLPLTKTLLFAMLKAAVSDYHHADDAEVRADIEANIAFISLPLKLIDPAFAVPNLGRVLSMVKADYDSLVFARNGKSAVFDRIEDFSLYRPEGWYKSSSELITFYRVKTWLSRLSYPINDITFDAEGVKVNNFRRSVLLYRSLELARIDNKPAYEYWVRLVRSSFLLGSQVESWQEKNLYCHDYKGVFKALSGDLNVTLSRLAEPLYRTKLLLAVRKQKPLSLSATSIFDLEDVQAAKNSAACFRFMPEVGNPEAPWLRWAAAQYPEPGITRNLFPLALMDLYAWGAPQAANFILDSSWAMDEKAARAVIELKRWVLRRTIAGQVQPVDNRIWNLMSPSWRLLPDGIQTALRVEMWANRRMESAFCAWLDSQICIAPPHYLLNQPPNKGVQHPPKSAPGGTPASTPRAQTQSLPANSGLQSALGNDSLISNALSPAASGGSGSFGTAPGVRPSKALRAARNHFLDPYPEFYNKLIADAQNIEKSMLAQGFSMDAGLKRALDDYLRLFQRLAKIAQNEVEGKPLLPADLSLLGNFDLVLDKIDLPLPATLSFEPAPTPAAGAEGSQSNGGGKEAKNPGALASIDLKVESKKAEAAATTEAKPAGYTFGLGRPGQLFIITQNKNSKEWTLARGAVYTFYEQWGAGMNKETLLYKIDRGTIQPPYWTERFDFVQAERSAK